MGQRANYLIKNNDELKIYYTHWRANMIAHDLLLGEKIFLKFCQKFETDDEVLDEVFGEGAVFLDIRNKILVFWEEELLAVHSVLEKYLRILQDEWPGWKITYAHRKMDDIEKVIGLSLFEREDKEFEKPLIDNLIEENIIQLSNEPLIDCLYLIKENGSTSLYLSNLSKLFLIGKEIISVFQTKQTIEFPNEELDELYNEITLIDIDTKTLISANFEYGLKEELEKIWTDWTIDVGDFGYLKILEFSGKDLKDIALDKHVVNEEIENIKNIKDDFDPLEFAQKLAAEKDDIQFNPHFFENIKPKKTSFLSRLLQKIFK